jgi:hypothetical protein
MHKNMTHINLDDPVDENGFEEQDFPQKKIFSLDSGL